MSKGKHQHLTMKTHLEMGKKPRQIENSLTWGDSSFIPSFHQGIEAHGLDVI